MTSLDLPPSPTWYDSGARHDPPPRGARHRPRTGRELPEPGALRTRQGDGFSTLRQWFPADVVGDPEDYARGKAAQFPGEGGPVVLRLRVPDEVVACTDTTIYPPEHGLVVFDVGYGFEELLAAWPGIRDTAIIRDVT